MQLEIYMSRTIGIKKRSNYNSTC